MQPIGIVETIESAPYIHGLQGWSLPAEDEGTLRVRVREADGCYIAKILDEPDLPHHGDGETVMDAIEMLCDVLESSWEGLCSASRLSSDMARRKARLDKLFSVPWTE